LRIAVRSRTTHASRPNKIENNVTTRNIVRRLNRNQRRRGFSSIRTIVADLRVSAFELRI
jgi:hypothetical protein